MIAVMSTRPGNRDPRYRPSPTSSGGWPATSPRRPAPVEQLPPRELRRRHLAEHPGCQWQARMVRCARPAQDVVESREGVLRSTCLADLPRWLRTGARRLVADPGWHGAE